MLAIGGVVVGESGFIGEEWVVSSCIKGIVIIWRDWYGEGGTRCTDSSICVITKFGGSAGENAFA